MLRTFLTILFINLLTVAAHSSPKVVVTIKPIHSLVAGVMADVGEPKLLIDGFTSPHDFNLKPSQAKSLQESDLIIWIGEGLETRITKSIENLSNKIKVLELLDIKSIKTYEFREEDEHHDDHAKHEEGEDHDDHAKHEEGEDHDNHAKHEEDDSHAGHDHGGQDPHLWLDTTNAITITNTIAKSLAEIDPENKDKYAANAKAIIQNLQTLTNDIQKKTANISKQHYVVFHDAYQYFEKQFGMSKPLALTINPEVPLGAARIKEIKAELIEENISCLFNEPQFSPKALKVIAENSDATISTLDPLGGTIDSGSTHYFQMMQAMADSFSGCLSK